MGLLGPVPVTGGPPPAGPPVGVPPCHAVVGDVRGHRAVRPIPRRPRRDGAVPRRPHDRLPDADHAPHRPVDGWLEGGAGGRERGQVALHRDRLPPIREVPRATSNDKPVKLYDAASGSSRGGTTGTSGGCGRSRSARTDCWPPRERYAGKWLQIMKQCPKPRYYCTRGPGGARRSSRSSAR